MTVGPVAAAGQDERESGRRWPLRRVFVVGAAVAAVVGTLAVVVGTVAMMRLDEARSVVLDVVSPAQSAGQALSVALLNQETGVRGFVISGGNPEFLEPYRAGRAAEADAVATLRELAERRRLERLGPDLAAVESAIASWHSGYVDGVVAGAAADPEAGRALFDQVRFVVNRLEADLSSDQVTAREQVDAAASTLASVGIAIAVAMALLLTAVGLGLRRGVLRPVSELARQVREVASGDFDRPVTVSGPREIAALGEDVETMRRRIVHELAAVRRAHDRLDEQARDLERSNRDLEQFAYVASHDLQEPLRKVASFCQLLQRRYAGQLDERADQYIAFAVDGAQRMQRLINDLLAFSRVGRTTEAFTEVDLATVAGTATAQLESARAEVDGEIVVDPLPTVVGDPVLLRQLLVNLIGNGLKFHRVGVAPVVRVTGARRNGAAEITVSDNGIGIEPEYADKVFVIFQRLHTRERYAGTGIGLALAKKIVEFHGGRIAVDTPEDGPGTVVRVTLPDHPQENA
ncbi:MAG: ATP-binding protein [Pseudonocardia sp.]